MLIFVNIFIIILYTIENKAKFYGEKSNQTKLPQNKIMKRSQSYREISSYDSDNGFSEGINGKSS